MHARSINLLSAILLGAATVAGLLTTATWSPVAAQPAAGVGATADKELEAAAVKVREGKLDEALRLLKEGGSKHPEWPPAQLIVARMLFNANQPAPGRRALEQAAAEAPDDPEVYLTLGTLALGEARISDARLNFEKVREIVRSGHWNAEKTKFLSREALAGLAAVTEAREDWKTTHEHLKSWLAIDPKNGQVEQRLGQALFRLGKTDEAFATLTQAVKDAPALEPAAVWMATLYTQKGDFKKADEWFERARKDEPKSARVRLAHAKWLLDRGRTADAWTEIEEAAKLDPALKEVGRVRGLIAWHQRDLPSAEAILEPLHRDAPADSAIANLLALSLLDQTDKVKRTRGLQLAEVNAAQFPRSAEIIATLGWALYRAGQLDQAEQKLRAAVTGGRTTLDIAYYLARVLAEKGQSDNARQLLESATNLPGAFAHRDDANSLLKTLKK
jgi:Tfp pilus assembly protein PilF